MTRLITARLVLYIIVLILAAILACLAWKACIFSCLLRRVHYGKMPAKIPVQGYVLWIHQGRRFDRVKTALLKRVMTIAEQFAK